LHCLLDARARSAVLKGRAGRPSSARRGHEGGGACQR